MLHEFDFCAWEKPDFDSSISWHHFLYRPRSWWALQNNFHALPHSNLGFFKIGPSKTCGRLFKGWFPQILLGLFLNTLFLLRIIIWCCTCYYNVKLTMMTCFGRTVDLWKALYLIFIRDNCQRFSTWQTSDTPQAGFEPTQNLSSGFFWIADSARGDLFSFFSLPFRRFQVWLLSTGRLSFTSGKSLSSGLFIYLLTYLLVYSLTLLNLAYILVHIYIKKHD